MVQGIERPDAKRVAVQRFGDAANLARLDRSQGLIDLARQVVLSGWGPIGGLAVGLSGVVAGLMRWAGAANRFMAGAPGNLNLVACRAWEKGYPLARSCGQAAVDDWANDIVWARLLVGVLGLIGLVTLWGFRRVWRRAVLWAQLPATVSDTVAATLFLASAAAFAVLGTDAVVSASGRGAGLWLSALPVALAAGGFFGLRLIRGLSSA